MSTRDIGAVDRYMALGDLYSIRYSGGVYSLWCNGVWQPSNTKSRSAARKAMGRLIGCVLDEHVAAAMRAASEIQMLKATFHSGGIKQFNITETP